MTIDSKKPGKQRKFLHKMPLHLKRKLLSAHLSEGLRKEFGRRSLPVRKGDTVKVMRGVHKKIEGKISRVDSKNSVVYLEKLLRKKVDGKEVFISVNASNLLITEVERKDERRFEKMRSKSNRAKRRLDNATTT